MSTAATSALDEERPNLEARLVETATAAGSVRLDNGTAPKVLSLSEPEVADMEAYLANMKLLPRWKSDGWRSRGEEPAGDIDLWRRLDVAMEPHDVRWHWLGEQEGTRITSVPVFWRLRACGR